MASLERRIAALEKAVAEAMGKQEKAAPPKKETAAKRSPALEVGEKGPEVLSRKKDEN